MKKIKKVFARIYGEKLLLVGCIGIVILILIMILAPVITQHPPKEYGPDRLLEPGAEGHWLGTNHLGQDTWSLIVYGTRTSVKVAVVAAWLSGIIGAVIGGISGYFGGKVDAVISELITTFMMIPQLFLIMLIVSMFGNSINIIMVVMGLTGWTGNARLMRAQALSIKQRTYVMSARAMGETRLQILFKYIIPNGIFPIISTTAMGMSGAILTEASLSFIGLGDPNAISWGQMISDGRQFITTSPYVILFAGAAIVFTVLIFNLCGDGLNHVLNPKHIKRGDR